MKITINRIKKRNPVRLEEKAIEYLTTLGREITKKAEL